MYSHAKHTIGAWAVLTNVQCLLNAVFNCARKLALADKKNEYTHCSHAALARIKCQNELTRNKQFFFPVLMPMFVLMFILDEDSVRRVGVFDLFFH